MVIRLLALVLISSTAHFAHANGGCTPGSEYEPPLCPIHLPKIKSVHIQENGAKAIAATDPAIDCSSFKVNERHLRRFWSRAKETNDNEAHHTLDWLPCYASGTLQFANGKQAAWSVNQAGIGSLSIEGKDAMVLYCPSCSFKPFAQ